MNTKQVPVEPTEEFLEQLKKRTAEAFWIDLSEKGARRLYDLFISLVATPAAGGHYTEGVCGDGAAILCDGQPITIAEVLRRLNAAAPATEPSETERLVNAGCKAHGPVKTNSPVCLVCLVNERDALRGLVARYRNETPLGHQPHMIAAEADKWLHLTHPDHPELVRAGEKS